MTETPAVATQAGGIDTGEVVWRPPADVLDSTRVGAFLPWLCTERGVELAGHDERCRQHAARLRAAARAGDRRPSALTNAIDTIGAKIEAAVGAVTSGPLGQERGARAGPRRGRQAAAVIAEV